MLQNLKTRVLGHYKTTLIGLACGVGAIVCQVIAESITPEAAAARPWTGAVAALLTTVGSVLKSKALHPDAP